MSFSSKLAFTICVDTIIKNSNYSLYKRAFNDRSQLKPSNWYFISSPSNRYVCHTVQSAIMSDVPFLSNKNLKCKPNICSNKVPPPIAKIAVNTFYILSKVRFRYAIFLVCRWYFFSVKVICMKHIKCESHGDFYTPKPDITQQSHLFADSDRLSYWRPYSTRWMPWLLNDMFDGNVVSLAVEPIVVGEICILTNSNHMQVSHPLMIQLHQCPRKVCLTLLFETHR